MEVLSNYNFLHERTEMLPPCKDILLREHFKQGTTLFEGYLGLGKVKGKQK